MISDAAAASAPPRFGQCFLCQRDVRMTRVPKGYLCPRCGSLNSAYRIDACKDVHGEVCKEYHHDYQDA